MRRRARTKGWMRAVLPLAAAAALTGCRVPGQTVIAELGQEPWRESVELLLPNSDTLHRYDWTLFLRCDKRTMPDAFTLQVTVLTPDSLRFTEPVRVVCGTERVAAALHREVAVDFRRGVQLARTGNYRLQIRPESPLHGIEAVGIQRVKIDTSD